MIIDEFSDYYAPLLDCVYDSVDRIAINAHYRVACSGGGMRSWWRNLNGGSEDDLDDTHLMRTAERFTRRVRAWGKAHDVPVVYCETGARKHEIADMYLPADPSFTGVFLVLVARSPGMVWKVGAGRQLTRKRLLVNHCYFHIMDPEWGHITVKMNCHPPFSALVLLNGHEWLERQACRQGIPAVKDDNCFTDLPNIADFRQVADALNQPGSIGRLAEVCNRWLYSACLCFALGTEEQKASGFHYEYSAFQLEYSRNLLFTHPRDLDQVYQGMLDRTRRSLDVKALKTIFGRMTRPYRRSLKGVPPPRLQVTLEKPTHDLTVFKLHFGSLTLKIYDKGERVLRVEAIAHDAEALRQQKDISRLPQMVAALREMVIRFLSIVRWAHLSFIDQGFLDALPMPSQTGKNRIAGVNMDKPRVRASMEALVALGAQPGGFTIEDLAERVRAMTGMAQDEYHTRRAAYDLRKFLAKGFIEKVPGSRRYVPTANGFSAMCALLILREKVLKPLLAAMDGRLPAASPQDAAPIDRHYVALRTELSATFETLGIAA